MDDEGTRRLGVGLGDKLNAVQATDSVYGLGFRAIAEHTNLAALAQALVAHRDLGQKASCPRGRPTVELVRRTFSDPRLHFTS